MKYLELFEMKQIKKFEAFLIDRENNLMIKESMEMSSLAKQLVSFLQKKGCQVDFRFSKWNTSGKQNLSMYRHSFGDMSGGSKTIVFKNGESSEKSAGKSQSDFTIICEIDEKNPQASKLRVMVRPINSPQEATFVSDFVKYLKDYMNQKPVDKSGKPLGQSFSEVLKIESPFGWDIDNLYPKIMEVIKKDGYFNSGLTPILTIRQIIKPKKQEGKFQQAHDKIEGLKKGEKGKDGNYNMFGSAFMITGKDQDKNRQIGILKVNDENKRLSWSMGLSDFPSFSDDKNVKNKIIDLAKRVSKQMGYEYVDSPQKV